MTAKERIAREARRAREARPSVPESGEEPVEVVEESGPGIEFEDRSDEEYRAAVLEVMAALDWVRQQRSRGNLPN
jgi:hypothetical protein